MPGGRGCRSDQGLWGWRGRLSVGQGSCPATVGVRDGPVQGLGGWCGRLSVGQGSLPGDRGGFGTVVAARLLRGVVMIVHGECRARRAVACVATQLFGALPNALRRDPPPDRRRLSPFMPRLPGTRRSYERPGSPHLCFGGRLDLDWGPAGTGGILTPGVRALRRPRRVAAGKADTADTAGSPPCGTLRAGQGMKVSGSVGAGGGLLPVTAAGPGFTGLWAKLVLLVLYMMVILDKSVVMTPNDET